MSLVDKPAGEGLHCAACAAQLTALLICIVLADLHNLNQAAQSSAAQDTSPEAAYLLFQLFRLC